MHVKHVSSVIFIIPFLTHGVEARGKKTSGIQFTDHRDAHLPESLAYAGSKVSVEIQVPVRSGSTTSTVIRPYRDGVSRRSLRYQTKRCTWTCSPENT